MIKSQESRSRELDAADPLASFRERFFFDPGDEVIYLDGNSLGRLPIESGARLASEVGSRWGSARVPAKS
jgi:kynureninase